MSVLTVTDLNHGFGDRTIFDNVSFRLLKGEHIALIGANGEGKSTFMNIITGQLQPDDGKIEWSKHQRVGYLDQHTILQKGMSIRDVLKTAFQYLFDVETNINTIYEKISDVTPEEMEKFLEEVGTLQDILTNNDFYIIDSKVEEVARGLGLDGYSQHTRREIFQRDPWPAKPPRYHSKRRGCQESPSAHLFRH